MPYDASRVLPLVVSLALAHGVAKAQEQPQGGSRLTEVTWSKSGTYEWSRPDTVRYILVRACGGGGGGGGGYSLFPRPAPKAEGGTASGGGGGAGSSVTTILLGPLTAARYTIVIGPGGAGAASTRTTSSGKVRAGSRGEAGMSTSFTGPDLSFETPGGEGGTSGQSQTRFSSEQNSYEFFVLRARSGRGQYPGGGSAQDGTRGLLGLGGPGNVAGDSGGGGGSLGKGGSGGGLNSAGGDGGTCAGGGGAGFLQNDRDSPTGGRGGDGSLTLLSLSNTGTT